MSYLSKSNTRKNNVPCVRGCKTTKKISKTYYFHKKILILRVSLKYEKNKD